MTKRPIDNLFEYVTTAQMPYMEISPKARSLYPPDIRNKSHKNWLRVNPRHFRCLDLINPTIYAVMDTPECYEGLRGWYKLLTEKEHEASPDDPLGEVFSMPCPPLYEVVKFQDNRVEDVAGVAEWVDNYPLMTAQRFLHCVAPSTFISWGFKQFGSTYREERDLMRTFVWTPNVAAPSLPAGPGGVVVVVQPPWVLADADMKELVRKGTTHVSDIEGAKHNPNIKVGADWTSRDRVWAKVWDCCLQHQTYSFVITTFERWIFGRFTSGRRIVYTSKIFAYDCTEPSIIECLIWWLKLTNDTQDPSDEGTEMHWEQVPAEPVAEPIMYQEEDIQSPYFQNYVRPAPSESDWSAKWSEPASSAGVGGRSPNVSDAGIESVGDISEYDDDDDDGTPCPGFPSGVYEDDNVDNTNEQSRLRFIDEVGSLEVAELDTPMRKTGRKKGGAVEKGEEWVESDKENDYDDYDDYDDYEDYEDYEDEDEEEDDDDDDTRTVRGVPLVSTDRRSTAGGAWMA